MKQGGIQYTNDELIAKAARLKRLSQKAFMRQAVKAGLNGKEMFFDTDAGRIRLFGYRLEDKEKLPLYVNLHGGGFILGCPEMDDPYMPRVASEAGVKILNVDYRLAPEFPFPQGVEDVYAVIKYAQEHADELGVDLDRIAVGGHSAGGNITAAICLMNKDRKELNIKCAILDYPPLDVHTDPDDKPRGKGLVAVLFMNPKRARFFDACYCIDREARKDPLISPVFAEPEALVGFPPTLILTAGKDSLCQEAERFRDMLIESGADVTHKRFEKSPHGFTLSDRPDAREGWTMMIDHLKKRLT